MLRTVSAYGTDRVAFTSGISGGSLEPNTYRGIWLGTPGDLQPVVLTNTTGDLGPGLGDDIVFAQLGGLALADDGTSVFEAALRNPDTAALDWGIWAFQDGELFSLIRVGDTILLDPTDPLSGRTISYISAAHNTLTFDPVNRHLAVSARFAEGDAGVIRLTLVPEPASALALGAVGVMLIGARPRRRAARHVPH